MLPDDETLAQRRQLRQGLHRPEVAVLIAYAKMTLYDELLASELPDDPTFCVIWSGTSPPLRKRFRTQIEQHRLRREIIATLVANSLVNRGLGEFVGELCERTGRSSAAVARAYIIARDAFGLVPLLGELELIASQVGAAPERHSRRRAPYRARGTEWFLRNLLGPLDMAAAVDRFAAGISDLLRSLDRVLTEADCRAFGQAVDHYLALACGSRPALRRAALSVHGLRGGGGRGQGRPGRGCRRQRVFRDRRLPAPCAPARSPPSRPARVTTGSAARSRASTTT